MAKNTKKQPIFQNFNTEVHNAEAPITSKDWIAALGQAYADFKDGYISEQELKQIVATANAVTQIKLNEIRVFKELKQLGNPIDLVKQIG